jgi:hypothetical protein
MNREELVETVSMADVLLKYGLQPNRSGFYPRDFHCYGCGANGDIFTFVEMMENVSFKEAFQILGGTYEKPTFASNLAIYRSQKKREMMKKEQEKLDKKRQLNNLLIDVYRHSLETSEPLSDCWCSSYNALQYQLYFQSVLNDDMIPY